MKHPKSLIHVMCSIVSRSTLSVRVFLSIFCWLSLLLVSLFSGEQMNTTWEPDGQPHLWQPVPTMFSALEKTTRLEVTKLPVIHLYVQKNEQRSKPFH